MSRWLICWGPNGGWYCHPSQSNMGQHLVFLSFQVQTEVDPLPPRGEASCPWQCYKLHCTLVVANYQFAKWENCHPWILDHEEMFDGLHGWWWKIARQGRLAERQYCATFLFARIDMPQLGLGLINKDYLQLLVLACVDEKIVWNCGDLSTAVTNTKK